MEIIVSHDVDHLTVWEHHKDLIIPKFLARQSLQFLMKRNTVAEFTSIFPEFLRNKWQNLDELMSYDHKMGIPATFFLGVENGLGMSYSLDLVSFWIKRIQSKGFKVGIHGVCNDNFLNMKNEYDIFRKLSGLSKIGIRMHYLRIAPQTLNNMNKVGYQYDSSVFGLVFPYKYDRFWEIPLCIMDVNVFYNENKWLPVSLTKAKEIAKQLIDQSFNLGLPYLTLLFHDRYFCSTFGKWREWYQWIIDYLKDGGVSFINYQQAIIRLENNLSIIASHES